MTPDHDAKPRAAAPPALFVDLQEHAVERDHARRRAPADRQTARAAQLRGASRRGPASSRWPTLRVVGPALSGALYRGWTPPSGCPDHEIAADGAYPHSGPPSDRPS